MKEFISYVDKDECCIPHDMLEKYAGYSFSSSNDVLKILSKYEFIESDTSYVRKLAGVDNGRTEKITYMLHPDVFKIILIRTQNTKKYVLYYLLLEKCVKHYTDYQLLIKDEKINEISKIKLIPYSDK